MRGLKFYFVGFLILLKIAYGQKVLYQTDWHEGSGHEGPVKGSTRDYMEYDIGRRFLHSDKINYLYQWGRLSLAAEMYPTPVKHHIGDEPASQVQTGDMDKDGYVDVIIGEGVSRRIMWYRNRGDGTFDEGIEILSSSYPCFTVGDINGDGYIDILVANDVRVFWFENDRNGSFIQHTIGQSPDVDAMGVADLDKDGDLDVISSGWSYDELCWWENDGTNKFYKHVIRDHYDGEEPGPIKIGDIDGDGWYDFVINAQRSDKLEWWKGYSGDTMEFLGPYTIEENYRSYDHAFDWLCDLDKDGDLDILSTADVDNSVDWWENNGGGGFIQHNISSDYAGARCVIGIDIDYDGDIDVITASEDGNSLDWWENDGDNNFIERRFSDTYTKAYGLWVADVDDNGFLDVLSTSLNGSVDWWDLFKNSLTPGELISSIFDSQVPGSFWKDVYLDAELKPNTYVEVYGRASDDLTSLNSMDWVKLEGGSFNFRGRYFQYRLVLKTEDQRYTPLVYEVRFRWYGADLSLDSIAINRYVEPGETIYPKVKVENTSVTVSDEGASVVLEIYNGNGTELLYKDVEEIPRIPPSQYEVVTFDKEWRVPSSYEDRYVVKSYVVYEYDYDQYDDLKIDTIFCKESGVEEDNPSTVIEMISQRIYAVRGVSNDAEIKIFDVSGRVVEKRKVNEGYMILDLSYLPQGVYYIVVEGKEVVKEKVIIY